MPLMLPFSTMDGGSHIHHRSTDVADMLLNHRIRGQFVNKSQKYGFSCKLMSFNINSNSWM